MKTETATIFQVKHDKYDTWGRKYANYQVNLGDIKQSFASLAKAKRFAKKDLPYYNYDAVTWMLTRYPEKQRNVRIKISKEIL